MAGTEHPRRRFVTRHDVEDAAAAGRPLVLTGRDTLTDEAAQRAMDLGVAIEREGGDRRSRTTRGAASPGGSGGRSGAASSEGLRKAVRAAVVAELGHEPSGLDAAIDRVLARRR